MSVLDRLDAESDWKNARRKLLYNEVVCLIKQCSVDLLSFDAVRTELNLRQKINRGLQEIRLDRIRGSVGRFGDFSAAFLPRKEHLRQRWVNVEVAMLAGKTPPIEVYQIGESYFVVDGNHRVSVARQLQQEVIEAYVWEYTGALDQQTEASLDQALLEDERAAFLERAGQANAETAGAITFTRSGCYDDLVRQVEVYRRGLTHQRREPPSFGEAFAAWHDEVYRPNIEAIVQHDLLAHFPQRTAADLFVWTRQNGRSIEELEEHPSGDET